MPPDLSLILSLECLECYQNLSEKKKSCSTKLLFKTNLLGIFSKLLHANFQLSICQKKYFFEQKTIFLEVF